MKISFLLHHAYGVGGTVRTVFNLAGALADRHDVEIASVFRCREWTNFDLGPEIRLTPLTDMRPGGDAEHPLHNRPARSYPASDGRYMQHSRLTEHRIRAWLAHTDADVVIGTRPGLNVLLARFAPQHVVRIGQEHLTRNSYPFALRTQLRHCYPQLDALVAVTEADAESYRHHMPRVRVTAIPNSVPAPTVELSSGTAPLVVAAGRLVPGKSFDQLVDAFAGVVSERPDWRLQIYGDGPERNNIQARIDLHALNDHVKLMGAHTSMDAQWASGSLAAVSSSSESFGMTIVEAMRCGLPVVSTNCPVGPAEIIHHGSDGLLIPVNDPTAMTQALLGLINDNQARRQMAHAARDNARRFDPHHISARYEALFNELLHARSAARQRRGRRLSTVRTDVTFVVTERLFRALSRSGMAIRHRAKT
ncbi:glycosyltransferase family 4 protein [Streptomyces sp.]|uniref:glycosyltransferase family 4 protein n=1 Tax=Streptomyces sp. TaxID=1931 RepID=UPI002D79792F|nr:glycosyltransferase family 4 protein [Streptomyces sp.]HET6354644.1 glycosyltransferase family 4 protein [Streptomyces sp.]